jgi:plastocyanin
MLVISCKKPQKVYTKFGLISSMRRILLVVVFLLGAILPGSLAEVSTSEEVVVTVDSTNLRFSPSSVTISEGDSVRFFWSGELLAHNAVAEDGLFDSGDTSRNVDYTFTFEAGTNGTYQYVCEPHESVGMVGTVVVEPMQGPVSPEPVNDTSDTALSGSGGTWIPFFGLEIVVLVMAAALIFQLGKAQGIGDVRLFREPESGEE